MHCPGHNTVGGSQLASEDWYFPRVKKMYLITKRDNSLVADD